MKSDRLREIFSRAHLVNVHSYNGRHPVLDHTLVEEKFVPNGADKSYIIQVARLAGLPKEILDRPKKFSPTWKVPAALMRNGNREGKVN